LQDERYETDMDVSGFEGVICNSLFVNNDISKFKSLEYIQLTSAGTDRVPMEKITAEGITLHTARGVYSIPMAEWAVCKALDFYKGTAFFSDNQKNKKWDKNRNLRELNGKTVCIVGFGSIGTECGKRFSAFGCNVTAVDIFPVESEYVSEYFEVSKLKEAFKNADIVILTLPLTSITKGIIGKDELNSMKEGSLLINIARGGLIDESALIEALKSEKIYAALDVFEAEPLSEASPLWEMPNALISPHNSFVSEGNDGRLKGLIFSNLETFVERRVEGFSGKCQHKHN
jgi:phosphoglycerate dehydrogenase-like enzyme